jgi:DNA-binding CsgD family transcriptional regulator
MKQELFNKEFNEMFRWFSNESNPGSFNLELDLYKKLLTFFVIGESYYFVINHHSLTCDFVSKEVEDVMGYAPSEFSLQFLNEQLHPDDKPWFLSNGHKSIEFFSGMAIDKMLKYKLRYDIRYRKKNGEYARILYQGVIIEHDDNGMLLRSLAVHTDITYLKKEGKPVLSFIGMDGEPSYVDVASNNILVKNKEGLTSREKQILTLLVEGKLSKQISSILDISKQTVDTHRKNMLRKNNLSNTGELIGKAIRCGWI